VTIVASPPKSPESDEAQLLFREARQRRRRRWQIAGTVGVVLTAGVAIVAVAVGSGHGPVHHTTADTGTSRFIPPTTTNGSVTTMVLRLPDGRGYDLTYPRSLDLSQFAVTAAGQINWPVSTGQSSCCSKASAPLFGSPSSQFHGKPLAIYRGADGQAVPYYSGTQERYPLFSSNMDYLVFRFGPWVVPVDDPARTSYFTARMTNTQRATWAASFDAHVTKDGYLVFSPKAPLQVLRGSIDVVLRGTRGVIEIAGPQTCPATQLTPQLIPAGRAWCDSGAEVRVSVTGQTGLVDSASSGLAIRSLKPTT
jgi:hypothetical protein